MAATGNVVAYHFAFAENEKESPWEPFHVDRGFKAKESVSLSLAEKVVLRA